MKPNLCFTIVFIAALMASCSNAEVIETPTAELRTIDFTAGLHSNAQTGIVWDGTERVGLYAVENHNNGAIQQNALNKAYSVSLDGNMSPADDVRLTVSLDASTTTVFSYLPFYSSLNGWYFPLNLSETNNHNFAYAKAVVSNDEETHLTFFPQLSKIKLCLKDNRNTVIPDALVWIERPVEAVFDLRNGIIDIDFNSVCLLPVEVVRGCVDTFVLPCKAGQIVVEVKGDRYHCDISNIDFKAGDERSYVLTLHSTIENPDGVTVEDWNYVDGGIVTPTPK